MLEEYRNFFVTIHVSSLTVKLLKIYFKKSLKRCLRRKHKPYMGYNAIICMHVRHFHSANEFSQTIKPTEYHALFINYATMRDSVMRMENNSCLKAGGSDVCFTSKSLLVKLKCFHCLHLHN